jgi:hypothetical protein
MSRNNSKGYISLSISILEFQKINQRRKKEPKKKNQAVCHNVLEILLVILFPSFVLQRDCRKKQICLKFRIMKLFYTNGRYSKNLQKTTTTKILTSTKIFMQS